MDISVPIKKRNTKIIIRDYHKNDFQRIVELDKEAQVNQELPEVSLLTNSDIIKASRRKGGWFIVIEIDKEVIGMGAMKKLGTKTCELDHIRITPKYQGLGIGSIMIKMIENQARKFHYSRIKCNTYQARKFYEKLGYTYVGQKEYSDGICDSIMEKKI